MIFGILVYFNECHHCGPPSKRTKNGGKMKPSQGKVLYDCNMQQSSDASIKAKNADRKSSEGIIETRVQANKDQGDGTIAGWQDAQQYFEGVDMEEFVATFDPATAFPVSHINLPTVEEIVNKQEVLDTMKSINVLSQQVYYLNKSRTKWVVVGLAPDLHFEPILTIAGAKKQNIAMKANQWKHFLGYQNYLTEMFMGNKGDTYTLKIGDVSVNFERVEKHKKVLKMSRGGEEIFLAYETLKELWKLAEILTDRLEILREKNYCKYYDDMINCIVNLEGDITDRISKFFNGVINENAIVTKELMLFDGIKMKRDVQLASTIRQ